MRSRFERSAIERGLLATSFLAFVLTSAPAAAYCQKSTCDPEVENCETDKYHCVSSGYGYVWGALPIPFRFASAGSSRFEDRALRRVVRAAFQKWEAVECPGGRTSVRFAEGKDLDHELAPGDASPLDFGIYFRDEGWPGAASALAITHHEPLLRSGRIHGASIEVNTDVNQFRLRDGDPGEYDVEAVLIHEVGHYLGLDHSSDPDSVMVADYCNGKHPCPKSTVELRSLGEDDVAGVCRLYPPPSAGSASSCAASSGPSSPHLEVLLAIALLLSARRARSRRSELVHRR